MGLIINGKCPARYLAKGDLEAMLKLTEEEVKYRGFAAIFPDLQDLV